MEETKMVGKRYERTDEQKRKKTNKQKEQSKV